MGGYGSTRWGSHWKANTVDQYRYLDAGRLSQLGVLRSNVQVYGARITWNENDGKELASIGYDARIGGLDGSIRLYYTWSRQGKSEEMDYWMRVVSNPRHVGGLQWYFVCPLSVNGRACGRRAKKLYLGGKWFGCRRCYGLTYRSCQESHQHDRVWKLLAGDTGWNWRDVKSLMEDRGYR